MDLLRQWRARLLGGAAAAVTVPMAIVVAVLAVGAVGGGLGGFSALGQALTGPGIPGSERSAASEPTAADDAGEILPGAIAASAVPGTRGAAGAPVRADAPGGSRGGRSPGGTPGRRPAPNRPPGAAPAPSQSPQPTPAPTEPPSTIRQAGDEVKRVTNQVPVAGQPAGEVVDLIVETAEQLPLP